MRLIYLVEWDAYSNSGVLHKVISQFETWRRLGVDGLLLLVSPRSGRAMRHSLESNDVKVVTYPALRGGANKVSKMLALREAAEICRRFRPDIIYYRQSSWTPGIVSLLSMARCSVMEVNSNDLEEIYQYGFLKARYHLATRKLLLNAVDGFVGVGEEISELYRAYGKPVASIGNGFDLNGIVPRKPPKNERAQLIFVGTAGQAWHGVDKLVTVADRFSDMDFHIVGAQIERVPKNFVIHGLLDREQLLQLYSKVDCGIGSLALHRNNMSEASPLKSREYLAHGLPVIGAYRDSDITDCDFFLRIANTESGLRESVGEVRDFVYRWKDKEIDMGLVRSRIDLTVKEDRRLEFLLRVLATSVV